MVRAEIRFSDRLYRYAGCRKDHFASVGEKEKVEGIFYRKDPKVEKESCWEQRRPV